MDGAAIPGGRNARYFVLTHWVLHEWVGRESPFTFVTDGIDSVLAQARAVARDKDVGDRRRRQHDPAVPGHRAGGRAAAARGAGAAPRSQGLSDIFGNQIIELERIRVVGSPMPPTCSSLSAADRFQRRAPSPERPPNVTLNTTSVAGRTADRRGCLFNAERDAIQGLRLPGPIAQRGSGRDAVPGTGASGGVWLVFFGSGRGGHPDRTGKVTQVGRRVPTGIELYGVVGLSLLRMLEVDRLPVGRVPESDRAPSAAVRYLHGHPGRCGKGVAVALLVPGERQLVAPRQATGATTHPGSLTCQRKDPAW